ncbi:hypothetical protein DW015_13195 [Ruminococcus sp. AF37-20]|uniref:hypothetical protein n=1 Tax=Ruminococcus sp. AF37-20 TaxID=2293178 RepID=UPI000E4CAB94|nr:hypothetical protein [Ruminococcus sp. AF37-20]RGF43362.1 hypothetical protein DW015_13195 [Ruminococcus sp. AF37-20]
MKKAITILAICSLLLTACGQIDDTESKSETTTAIASESTAGEDTAETSSAKEEKDTSEATTTTRKSSQTVSSSSKPTGITVTTTKKSGSSGASGNSIQGQNNSVQNNNGQVNYQPEQNNQQPDNNQSNNGAQQNNQSSDNKPQNNNPSPPVTTAKPAVTNPPTTTTPKPQTEPPAPEPTEEERYMGIGRNLLHDGSDYSKAEAVYNWMTENGSGTCVNYSYKTYLICQGIGLDCYACWTDSGIYGHVANIVKVDGIWYVLDTQAGAFLDYNYGFTEVVDIDENHIADGRMISDYSYEELHE